MSREIGGYFELALENHNNFPYPSAFMFQSLRAALVHFLNSVSCRKVYIPKYCCPTIEAELRYAKVGFEAYHINSNYEPELNFSDIGEDEYFFYVNYFGLCDDVIHSLGHQLEKLIIDNSHALFGTSVKAACQLFSPRKFAGLPDGGVMLCSSYAINEPEVKDDASMSRMGHLLLRASDSAASGYEMFQENRATLKCQPPKLMSNLTKRLISHIDWDQCKEIRTRNFSHLHKALGEYNHHQFIQSPPGAFCYPLFIPDINVSFIRDHLIKDKVYVPQFWPDIDLNTLNRAEKKILDSTIFLPVDQRNALADLDIVIKKVRGLIEK